MLRAAIVGGADAVYLGLKQFSARASAGNFSPDELLEGTRLAHAYGVRVYVALNTLMTDRELRAAKDCVRLLAQAPVDGVIVQDLGLFSLLKACTDLPLHLSTQGGVFNVAGAAFAKELGFSRVVLARETQASEIRKIRDLGIEVEVFVHGAMCTGFSGNCYLSSFLSSTSGNRGRCLQPCRLPYRCFEKGKEAKPLAEGYLLSSRDECLLERVPELVQAGADSLKIEGRLKRPEYAAECARVYRAAVEGKARASDLLSLKKLYHRGGFSQGLAWGRDRVICREIQGHGGVPVGRVKKLGKPFGKGRLGETDADAAVGDGFKILRGGREIGGATFGAQGLVLSAGAREGDELFRTTDARQLAEISTRTRPIPVRVILRARAGEPLFACLEARGVRVEKRGALCEIARSSPLIKADFEQCFQKTGDFPFAPEKIEVETTGVFLPKSALNGFRRDCYESLFEELARAEPRRFDEKKFDEILDRAQSARPAGKGARSIGMFARDCAQAEDFDLIVLSPDCYFTPEFWQESEKLCGRGAPVYLDLPLFLFDRDFEKFRIAAPAFAGICAHNAAGVALARDLGIGLLLSPDLNLMNVLAVETYRKYYPCDAVLSEELCAAQAEEISKHTDANVLALGKQILMRLNHCAARETLGGTCADCRYREMTYRNEYGQNFSVTRLKVGNIAADGTPILDSDEGEHCYFLLENGVFTDKRKAPLPARLFFDFRRGEPEGETTFGHWKRRVL